MIIRAAIVEDDKKEMHTLRTHMERCSKERGFLYTVDCFTDGDAIVENILNGYDIIFLDIEMPLMNGMDAAEQIREADKDVTIIFTTHNPNYAIRGYKVQALDYILKPVSYSSFDDVMERAFRARRDSGGKFIKVKVRSGTVKLDVSTIRYVDVFDHYVCYHTPEGEVKSKTTMREVMKELEDEAFFQCNKAYLVNLAHVDGITGNDLMIAGEKIPVSRARKKAFLEAMNRYLAQ